MDKLAVIVRTAGERTFPACSALLRSEIAGVCIDVASERPFEATLRRSYEIGIARNTKWTMTLDADVLVRAGALRTFIQEAERLPEHFLQIEGLVHDKLTGLFRKAGHRIYRTRHLRKALEALPAPGLEARPEYATLQRMQECGFPSREINLVVGIHDYEQFYGDIYRKAFVHANKHQVWLAEMVNRWRKNAASDPDFRIALRGLCDGLMSTGVASLDTRKHSAAAAAALRDLTMKEKDPLPEDFPAGSYTDSALREAGEMPSSLKGLEAMLQRLDRVHAKCGTIRAIPFLIGIALCRTGTLLKALAMVRTARLTNPRQ